MGEFAIIFGQWFAFLFASPVGNAIATFSRVDIRLDSYAVCAV